MARRLFLVGLFGLLLEIAALAQTTGNIEGTVTDRGGAALPGVTVTITSLALQGSRTVVTDADGRYRFPILPPGTYTVTGELPGFGRAQRKATVTLSHTETVALQLSLSTTAAVTVSGEMPVVDTTSTATGTNYTAKVIEGLPVNRNYADVVRMQPGVQTDSGETQGGRATPLSIYGSTSAENLWIIDGVNTTNVIKGLQGKDINTEFIQEVEVKTGGYQAEYGRNTGGVINVITKSGGNEFHGGAFGYYNNTSMRARQAFVPTENYAQSGDAQEFGQAVLTKDNRQEIGADLGGFILKDRIWFFAAYDRVTFNQETSPTSGPVAGQNFPIDIHQNKWSGKLTFNLFQGTSIVGSYFSDRQTQTGAVFVPAGGNPNTYAGRRDTGGPDYAARLNQLFGSFGIFTFQYAHHEDRNLLTPEGVDIPLTVDRTPTAFGGVPVFLNGFGQVFGPVDNNASKRSSYGGSFTAYVRSHEIKAGGDYQKDDTFGATYFTGRSQLSVLPCTQQGTSVCDLSLAPIYTNSLGQTIPVFYEHDFFTANGQDLTPLAQAPFNTPTNRWGVFVQDQWRVLPNLTVNVGVRLDEEDLKRGDGVSAFKLDNQWAPRLGVVWDFLGDGTSKLYASAGRFYYSLPTDLNVRVFTANTGVTSFNYSPTDLTQDPNAPRKALVQVGSFSGEPVDPGIKAAYQDELTLGVEKALDPTLSVGLKGTYRTLGRTVEDRCDLNYNAPQSLGSSCALMNPGSNSPGASGAYGTCDGSGNPTDPTAGQCFSTGYATGPARRLFRGIEVMARKRFSSELWAQASFLYSSLRGNYSGAIKESTGQTDPGINADFDYYQLTQNTYGNLDLDRPIQARLDAAYTAPFGFVAGLQFYVRSGTPISRNGFFNQFYSQELFLDPRGTVFGVEARTPTDYEMNLSVGYEAKVGAVTVTPMIYVFNLLNRQTPTTYDQVFNSNGSFVTYPASPFYGQGGVEPGTAGPDGVVCNSARPCPDNINYGKITARTNPRFVRVALKLTF